MKAAVSSMCENFNIYFTGVKKRILFVINPKSGRQTLNDADSIISRHAANKSFDYTIYRTTGEADQKAIRRLLAEFNPDTVLAAGGDGTVNLVATELIGREISLGILPAGSANGLAYNLQIPEDLEEALLKNLEMEARGMDVIKMNDRYYCLHLADIGLNARIVKRFEKEGSKGMSGYGKQLFRELFGGKTSFSFSIEMPGHRRRKMKAEMVVIANAKAFGTGAMINPTGKMNDGKFEIIIIRPYPWWFVFIFIYAAFSGHLHKMKYVRVFSSSGATIQLKEKQDFQADGEVIPDIDEIRMEIIPEALRMIGI